MQEIQRRGPAQHRGRRHSPPMTRGSRRWRRRARSGRGAPDVEGWPQVASHSPRHARLARPVLLAPFTSSLPCASRMCSSRIHHPPWSPRLPQARHHSGQLADPEEGTKLQVSPAGDQRAESCIPPLPCEGQARAAASSRTSPSQAQDAPPQGVGKMVCRKGRAAGLLLLGRGLFHL